ncbi:MAG: phosphoribosylaminoimidazolesuccinocarboxamide synthase, partial [Elusimicrobiales bacterium]|nr:phosphoribosylaminoimidazolesuccinocarboxamide synthase [Elusimicrobiales bacterium]
MSLKLKHKGKVRELYEVGDKYLLMVASDRVSAFDFVLPTDIPRKGELLSRISVFWFEKTKH